MARFNFSIYTIIRTLSEDQIEKDVDSTVSDLEAQLTALTETITDYSSYTANKKKVDSFYKTVISETKSLGIRLREYSVTYAELILGENSSASDKYEDLDDLYDALYEDACDDLYDDIYEDLLGEAYDAFYNGVLEDAYDTVDYSEWSEASSEAYKQWSDSSSKVYKQWSKTGSDIYSFWSDLGTQLIQGDLDDAQEEIDDFKKDIAKLKKKSDKKKSSKKGSSDKTSDTKKTKSGKSDKKSKTSKKSRNSSTVSGVDPDLKAFLDSYEECMNEYCDFMEKYENASSAEQILMLADYAVITAKYVDFAAKAEAYDEDTMSNEDLAYYMDVTTRVNKRLLEVAD